MNLKSNAREVVLVGPVKSVLPLEIPAEALLIDLIPELCFALARGLLAGSVC